MIIKDIFTLGQVLGEILASRKWQITTAESCTGGLLSSMLTETPGSSSWFEQGIVSYSNAVKIRLLHVKAETLQQHGAVSEEVAREMASGARDNAKAAIGIAVTGIAGPDGGSVQKPVGMVCFGWALPDKVESATSCFNGDRQAIRLQSVRFGLEMLLQHLQGRE